MSARTALGVVGVLVALGAAGALAWMTFAGEPLALPSGEDARPPSVPTTDAPPTGAQVPPTPVEAAPGEQDRGEAARPPGPPPSLPRPLAFWTFEPQHADGRYYAKLPDASGRGHDLVLVRNVTPIEGKVGKAARFGGDDAYAWIPNRTTLQFPGDWTFATWLRVADAGPHALFAKTMHAEHEAANAQALLWLENGTVRYRHERGAGEDVDATLPSVPVGAWAHVALVRAAGELRLYVDGALAGSAALASGPTGGEQTWAWLGHDGRPEPVGLRADLDETGVWDEALDAPAIRALCGCPEGARHA